MSDLQDTGPLSTDEAVSALFEAPQGPPEAEPEEAQDAEPVESTEEDAVNPEKDTEPEAADPEEDDEGPQHLDLDDYGDLTIPIVVNGEEKRVSLSEAAKGYRLQSDYTRKTQALADERKAFEAERASLTEEMNRQREQIAQMVASQKINPPDPALATEDPDEYVRQLAEYQTKQQHVQAIEAEREQRRAEIAAAEGRKLVERVPELADPNNARVLLDGAVEHYGFTADDVMQTVDSRILAMAYDAIRYRKGLAAKVKVVDKVVRNPGKVAKPGTAKGKAEIQADQDAANKRKLAKPGGVSVDEYLAAKFG